MTGYLESLLYMKRRTRLNASSNNKMLLMIHLRCFLANVSQSRIISRYSKLINTVNIYLEYQLGCLRASMSSGYVSAAVQSIHEYRPILSDLKTPPVVRPFRPDFHPTVRRPSTLDRSISNDLFAFAIGCVEV